MLLFEHLLCELVHSLHFNSIISKLSYVWVRACVMQTHSHEWKRDSSFKTLKYLLLGSYFVKSGWNYSHKRLFAFRRETLLQNEMRCLFKRGNCARAYFKKPEKKDTHAIMKIRQSERVSIWKNGIYVLLIHAKLFSSKLKSLFEKKGAKHGCLYITL